MSYFAQRRNIRLNITYVETRSGWQHEPNPRSYGSPGNRSAAYSASPNSAPLSSACSSRSFRTFGWRERFPNAPYHTGGHFYFTLKDGQSQLKCILFKGTARLAKFRPQDGLAVLARGRVDLYEPRGEYRLIFDLLGQAAGRAAGGFRAA